MDIELGTYEDLFVPRVKDNIRKILETTFKEEYEHKIGEECYLKVFRIGNNWIEAHIFSKEIRCIIWDDIHCKINGLSSLLE